MTPPYNTNLTAGGLKLRRAPWVKDPAQAAPVTQQALASLTPEEREIIEALMEALATREVSGKQGTRPEKRFRLRQARLRRVVFVDSHAWMTIGAQIRAARALLGWTRADLADAAGLHTNAVAYWERHEVIPSPPDADLPFACHRITDALRRAGVVMVGDPGPGVALKPDRTGQTFEALYGKKGTTRAAFEDLVRRPETGTGPKEQSPPS